MIYRKTKLITEWISAFLNEYAEYKKQAAPHRCKVVGIETDKETGKNKFLVKMNGVKSQISISYYPEELVANDWILREFSQTDVRAITFYAINNSPKVPGDHFKDRYKIIGQEFLSNKTLFIFKEWNSEGEHRMLANELYSDADLLKQFNFDDLMNIMHTAVQEQTIEDIG